MADEASDKIGFRAPKGTKSFLEGEAEKETTKTGFKITPSAILCRLISDYMIRLDLVEEEQNGGTICIKCARRKGLRKIDCRCDKQPPSKGGTL